MKIKQWGQGLPALDFNQTFKLLILSDKKKEVSVKSVIWYLLSVKYQFSYYIFNTNNQLLLRVLH